MRILELLSDKAVLVSGEIEVQGLLKDGLIFNAHTFETQSISISDNFTNQVIFNDIFVQSFAARLTPKVKNLLKIGSQMLEILLIFYDWFNYS